MAGCLHQCYRFQRLQTGIKCLSWYISMTWDGTCCWTCINQHSCKMLWTIHVQQKNTWPNLNASPVAQPWSSKKVTTSAVARSMFKSWWTQLLLAAKAIQDGYSSWRFEMIQLSEKSTRLREKKKKQQVSLHDWQWTKHSELYAFTMLILALAAAPPHSMCTWAAAISKHRWKNKLNRISKQGQSILKNGVIKG